MSHLLGRTIRGGALGAVLLAAASVGTAAEPNGSSSAATPGCRCESGTDALAAQSRFLAFAARTATAGGNATLGGLLALAALPRDLARPDRPIVVSALHALEDAWVTVRERRRFGQGDAPLETFTYALDGQRLVTASSDEARLWDVRTGALLATMPHGPQAPIVVSNDGRRLAVFDGSSAGVWDAADGRRTSSLATGNASSASMSNDGKRVVSVSGEQDGPHPQARLWDADSGKSLLDMGDGSVAYARATVSANAAIVVTTTPGKPSQVWSTASGKVVGRFIAPPAEGGVIGMSDDGTRFVTATMVAGAGAILYDLHGARIAKLEGSGLMTGATFSPDGTRVVTTSTGGDNDTMSLWQAKDGRLVAVLSGQYDRGSGTPFVAFARNGSRFLTVPNVTDQVVWVWGAEDGQQLTIIRGAHDNKAPPDISPDGRHVAVASEHGFGIWSAESGRPELDLRDDDRAAKVLAYAPDGRSVASAGEGAASVHLWDTAPNARDGRPLDIGASITLEALSPDGARLAVATDGGAVQVWDTRSHQRIATLVGHRGEVTTLAFSGDGTRLLSAGHDGTVRLWSVAESRGVVVIDRHDWTVGAAYFTPDGTYVVTIDRDGRAGLWDGRTGAFVRPVTAGPGRYAGALVSPDKRLLLIDTAGGDLALWDVESGERRVSVGHLPADFGSLAFSGDGRRLVAGMSDGTARMWQVSDGKLLNTFHDPDGNNVAAAISADGRRVVTHVLSTVRLWDADSGSLVAALRHENLVSSADFYPGDRLMTITAEGAIWLSDTMTGAPVTDIRRNADGYAQVTPDGMLAAFPASDSELNGGNRRAIELWRMPPRCQALVDDMHRRLPRSLTDAQKAQYDIVPLDPRSGSLGGAGAAACGS